MANLYDAASVGNVNECVYFIRAGEDINYKNYFTPTPLYIATLRAHQDVVKTLLKYGADPEFIDSKGYSCLYVATLYGYTKIVKLLLKHGANKCRRCKDGETPLECAIRRGHEEIIKLFSK